MSAPPMRHLLNHLRRRARPTDPASDRSLLSAYVAGDQTAFTELVRRHGAMVRGVGRRILGDAHAAEDVGQATFLVLARKAPIRAWEESVGGWLHGVAYRLALKARAAARRPIAAGEPRPAPATPDAEAAHLELQTLLDGELRTLPARYRGPIVLCYLEGRTRDEAARQLGVTVAALKGRLERGRDMLRDRLTRRGCCLGLGLTAAALADDAAAAAPISERWADIATGHEAVPVAVERLAGAAVLAGHGARWGLVAGFVGLAAATAGLALGIGADPPQSPALPVIGGAPAAAVRTDRFGDPLPAGARARLGTLRWRAGGLVKQVAFSPEGKIVIAATSAGLQFWDATNGRPLEAAAFSKAKFDAIGPLEAVALTSDGATLATASSHPGPVRLWDVAVGRELPFPKTEVEVAELAFAPDGKTLAARPFHHGAAMLWEVASGKAIGELKHVKDSDPPEMEGRISVGWMAYAPDGRSLYTVASRRPTELSVWDTATGRLTRTSSPPAGVIEFNLALSNDGKTIASPPYLIDVASGRRKAKGIKATNRPYLACAFVENGNMLVASCQQGTDFLDVATGELRFSTPDVFGNPAIGQLFVNPSGSRVYRSHIGRQVLQVWDAKTGGELEDSKEFVEGVGSLAIASDGHTLLATAGHGDPRVRRWDIRNASESPDPLFQLAFYAEGIQLQSTACSSNGQFVAWTGREQPAMILRGVAQIPNPNGKLIPLPPVRRPRELVTIVDVRTGKAVQTMEAPRARSLAWSPDGKKLASVTADHDVQIWEGETGTVGRKFSTGNNTVGDVAFSADGKMLAATNVRPAAVTVWNASNGDTLQKIALVRDGETAAAVRRANLPKCVAFAPDGQSFVVGVTRGIRRWGLAGGKELPSFAGPAAGTAKCMFSPDGRILFAGGADGSVWAWDATTGDLKISLAGHSHAVTSMILTPDGKTLITGSADTTILIWDIASW